MKSLAATAAICLLTQSVPTQGVLTQGFLTQGLLIPSASAQTRNCKALTDPLDQLTCNARINPQSAAQQAKPSQYVPRTRRDITPDNTAISGDDEMMVNRKMNGICRGC